MFSGQRIDLIGQDLLQITGWSSCLDYSQITRETARSEMTAIRTSFERTLDESLALQSFANGKQLQFKLAYDDAGKASLDICVERDGELKWLL